MSHKNAFIIAAAILIVGGGATAFAVARASRKPDVAYQSVVKGDLVRTIALTGTVTPTEAVDLAFERGGRIARVNVDVGAKITAGQTLVALDASDLYAQLAQMTAARDAAKARLASLQSGLRPEETVLQQSQVGSADEAMAQAKAGLVDKITSAYASADDAVRGKVDQFFTAPTGPNPHLAIFVPDSSMTTDIEWNRLLLEQQLVAWNAQVVTLTPASDLSVASNQAHANLTRVNAFLTQVALAIDKTTAAANPGMTDAMLANDKTILSAARASIAGASASVTAAEQQLKIAQAGVTVAQAQSDVKHAGASPEDIAAQEAVVRQADAAVQSVQVQIAKTVLRAPFNGVVTRSSAHVGATASANAPLISVISDGAFEIKAQASEIDVADLHPGDAATVTLDAYGAGTPFEAKITAVDPAESNVNGVVSYTVTAQFAHEDDRIKSGMTANLSITAGTRTGVVTAPRSALMFRGDKAFVLVEGANGPETREVTVGLHGSDDRYEITNGLTEGDHIAGFGASSN